MISHASKVLLKVLLGRMGIVLDQEIGYLATEKPRFTRSPPASTDLLGNRLSAQTIVRVTTRREDLKI